VRRQNARSVRGDVLDLDGERADSFVVGTGMFMPSGEKLKLVFGHGFGGVDEFFSWS